MTFIDLTKAFDLVNRKDLFQLLERTGCLPILLSLIQSFHNSMKAIVQCDGDQSDSFEIHSDVGQGGVLAPTFFSLFFSLLGHHLAPKWTSPYKIRWKTLQPCMSTTKKQSQTSADMRSDIS
ncbi:unnamed protein product [Eretmochelys imbricata]